jgi:hypothetical protein
MIYHAWNCDHCGLDEITDRKPEGEAPPLTPEEARAVGEWLIRLAGQPPVYAPSPGGWWLHLWVPNEVARPARFDAEPVSFKGSLWARKTYKARMAPPKPPGRTNAAPDAR